MAINLPNKLDLKEYELSAVESGNKYLDNMTLYRKGNLSLTVNDDGSIRTLHVYTDDDKVIARVNVSEDEIIVWDNVKDVGLETIKRQIWELLEEHIGKENAGYIVDSGKFELLN